MRNFLSSVGPFHQHRRRAIVRLTRLWQEAREIFAVRGAAPQGLPVDQQVGRFDTGSALPILLITGLLTYQRDSRPNRGLAEHSTRSAGYKGRGRCYLRVQFF
jgi:hypothetical protein